MFLLSEGGEGTLLEGVDYTSFSPLLFFFFEKGCLGRKACGRERPSRLCSTNSRGVKWEKGVLPLLPPDL